MAGPNPLPMSFGMNFDVIETLPSAPGGADRLGNCASMWPICRLDGADIVAKVENRTTLKISRKLIFRHLCCCIAFQRHYAGP